jgi:hypothetical protein
MPGLLDVPHPSYGAPLVRETDLLPMLRQRQYDQYLLDPANDAPIAPMGLPVGEATAGPAFMRGRIKGLLGDNPFSRGINNLSELLGINFAHDIFQREQSGMGTTPLERGLAAAMVLPIPMQGKGAIARKIAREATERVAARDAAGALRPSAGYPVAGPPPTPELVSKTLQQQQAATLPAFTITVRNLAHTSSAFG